MDDDYLIQKYKLKRGQAILAEENHMPIFKELWENKDMKVIPGGSALNTARAANWMLRNFSLEKRITFFGSIGDDEHGEALEYVTKEIGVTTNFDKTS